MDKARLDWLEEKNGLLNNSEKGPHVCVDDGREGYFHAYGNTYREAMDNAMREYVPYDRNVVLANLEARYLRALADYEKAKAKVPDAANGRLPEEKS